MSSTLQIVNVKIERDMVERLDALAEAMETNRSALIRGCISASVEQQEQLAAVMSNPVLAKAYAKMFSSPEVIQSMAAALTQKLEPDQLRMFGEQIKGIANAAHESHSKKKQSKTKGKK